MKEKGSKKKLISFLFLIGVCITVFYLAEREQQNRLIVFPVNTSGRLTSLELSEEYHHIPTEQPVMAASITHYQKDWFIIAHYQTLCMINVNTGEQKDILPEHLSDCTIAGDDARNFSFYDDSWNPTGVYYSPRQDKLFVANYNGHNVYVGTLTAEGTFAADKMIVSEGMISPEGISVNEAGDRIAIADNDGNKLFFLNGEGELLWMKEVSMAHGVAISENSVYVTSLSDRTIIRFDYNGHEIRRTGHAANKGANKFLWPADVVLCSSGQLIIIDPHSGRLTVLDENLQYQTSLGCNGPYASNFNYPYAAAVTEEGLYIADTFNERIVKMNFAGVCQLQISQGSPFFQQTGEAPYVPDYPYEEAYMYEALPDIPPTILGEGEGYQSKDRVIAGYSALWTVTGSKLLQKKMISYSSRIPWFDHRMSNELYDMFGVKANTDGHTYYIFGSDKSDSYVFYCPDISFGGCVWLQHRTVRAVINGQIIGNKQKFGKYLDLFDQMTDSFAELVKEGKTRYQAYCDVFMKYFDAYYPDLPVTKEEFQAWIRFQCSATEEARDLISRCETTDTSGKDYHQYIQKSASDSLHTVFENFLFRTFCNITE